MEIIFLVFENFEYDMNNPINILDIFIILASIQLVNLVNRKYSYDIYFHLRLLSILLTQNCNLLLFIGSHIKLQLVLITIHSIWNTIFSYYMLLFKLYVNPKLDSIEIILYYNFFFNV